jgi:geranylgeranyl pyrophosphate synthase
MENDDLERALVRINAPVHKRIGRIFEKYRDPKAAYGLLSEFLLVEGKRLRPALCLLSCEVVGGMKRDALPAATAIEMFHNFTLIHDDIEDCSQLRRGKPCLHVKYGVPLAINAGDGLFMMVWRETLRIRGIAREDAQKRLLDAFTSVLEGQALELGWYWNGKWDVSEKEYLKMVGGKTGALIAVSCEVGALLGGANARQCAALKRFGMGVGVGFQIMDDVLNIVGEEKKYRKEIGGDVCEGKRTLITMHALRCLGGKERARLVMLLKKDGKSDLEIKEAIALLISSGAPKKALSYAKRLVAESLAELDSLPKNKARDMLLQIAGYITRREK